MICCCLARFNGWERSFRENPEVDVIYGHRILIDEHDREIGRWILPPHNNNVLDWADWIPQETLFWRRAIWERVGGSVSTKVIALQWIGICYCGSVMPERGSSDYHISLGGFRVHDEQKTSVVASEHRQG